MKVTDLGNAAVGRSVGMSRVRFADSTVIEFDQPAFKIAGLMFGKRLSHWLGHFTFEDKKHNLKAKLEFSPIAGFFSRRNLPCDCIQGSITQYGNEISKIEGSWVEFIRFDEKM